MNDGVKPLVVEHLADILRSQRLQSQIKLGPTQLQIGLYTNQLGKGKPIPNRLAAIAFLHQQLDEIQRTEPDMASELATVTTVQVYGLKSVKKAVWKESFALPSPSLAKDDVDLYSFNNRYSNAIVFPVATILALLLNASPITQLLLRGLQIWVHEFGHATVAWLSGYRAIPLPFGWTNTGLEQSWFVYFGVLTLLGLLGWAGYREQRRWPMALAIILAVLQIVMTWGVSAHTYRMLMAFGGIGGEFYLSALLLVSFYFPLPDYWQWEFWRYPVAIAAAYTFWHIFGLWHSIQKGEAAIPWGTLWAGMGDANGDMNILSGEYGWSDQRIIGTYTTLGNLCLLLLIGVYLYFVLRQHRMFFYRLLANFRLVF